MSNAAKYGKKGGVVTTEITVNEHWLTLRVINEPGAQTLTLTLTRTLTRTLTLTPTLTLTLTLTLTNPNPARHQRAW